MIKIPNSLGFRLTFWYTLLFAIFFSFALIILYLSIEKILDERLDSELEEEVDEFTSLFIESGIQGVENELKQEEKTDDTSAFFIRVLDKKGKQLHTTPLDDWTGVHSIETTLNKVLKNPDSLVLETVHFPSQEHETRIIYGKISSNLIVQIGESTEENNEITELLPMLLGMMFLIALPIASLIGWLMAKKSVAGINEVTQAAMAIKDGNYNHRIAANNQYTELKSLSNVFNDMAGRIEHLMKEMREMIDNIAHDMRSPLTRIKAISETAISNNLVENEYSTYASDTLEECDRLITMINTTLDVAEAESGVNLLTKEDVNLTEIIEEACDIFDALAEEKNVELSFNLIPECKISGNKQSLQRMIANLVDNAIKYTSKNSIVRINLDQDIDKAIINVSDQGQGITKEYQTKIFQRFFRCDESRTNKGNGLGLSYAIAVARLHGGDISIKESSLQGTTFSILLSN